MFSGIVEAQGKVTGVEHTADGAADGLLRIAVERPAEFNDLALGDSVCNSGVCLTVERLESALMHFALGAETLRVVGWTADNLLGRSMNLERSLRFGDRIHGHLVSGHVDTTGEIIDVKDLQGSTDITVLIPQRLQPFVWKKGSWAVNGVSLTINEVEGNKIKMCLIPETLNRTNLSGLKPGERVNLEIDMFARGMIHYFQNHGQNT